LLFKFVGTCEEAMNTYLIEMKETLQTKSCPQCKGNIFKYKSKNIGLLWKRSKRFKKGEMFVNFTRICI